MRHTLRLSLLASVITLSVSGADDLAGMFKEGKMSGQLRAFSISRDYDGSPDYTRTATAIGGYLKYDTAAWNGVSLGGAFYTTNGVFLRDDKADYTRVDPTLLGKNNASYTLLGEAYVQYKNQNTTFKGGRQKLDTPMAGSDDARMLPNLFEAYILGNTDIKDTTLIAGHVTKFAQGTFGRVYNAAANANEATLSVTSGYSYHDSRNQVGEFVDMGSYAINRDTSGISIAAAVYSPLPGLKLQLWDYYAHDILNAVYAEATYGWSYSGGIAPYAGVQYIREDNIGSDYAGNINSDFISAKIGAKFANFDVYGALSHNTKDPSATINGGTMSPWGGMSAYTQGMVTRHQFMAGTDAWKASGSYNWKEFGVNLDTGAYYASYEMDSLNGYVDNHTWTATEAGFDMIYYPESIRNLQLRLRGNFPRDFKESAAGVGTDWDEYRFIVNYNF